MLRLLLAAPLVLLAACDTSPAGEPGATYPFAGAHPTIQLQEIPDIRPTQAEPNLYRNVEVVVDRIDPCSGSQRAEGACVTDTITLVGGTEDPTRFVLPADSPGQFTVGARFRVTLYFFAGDDSVAVYLRGYTRL